MIASRPSVHYSLVRFISFALITFISSVALTLVFVTVFFAPAALAVASGGSLEFKIPPTRIPLNIKNQPVTIVASGVIAMVASGRDTSTFRVQLAGDLSDLQRNITPLLSSQLDKDDRCGEHIEIQNVSLTPAPPASAAVVQLHYERRACVKVFGKEKSKRLVAGNATIQLKLTPLVGANHTELSLEPEVGPIQADGSLGEVLRSGSMGEMLRDKIRSSVRSAMEKGTDLRAVIPPAAQNAVNIQSARFEDGGSGRLAVMLIGEIRITKDQIQQLSRELKERARGVSQSAK